MHVSTFHFKTNLGDFFHLKAEILLKIQLIIVGFLPYSPMILILSDSSLQIASTLYTLIIIKYIPFKNLDNFMVSFSKKVNLYAYDNTLFFTRYQKIK